TGQWSRRAMLPAVVSPVNCTDCIRPYRVRAGLAGHFDPQECGRNRRTIRARVLSGEQLLELRLQAFGAPVLLRRVEGIHRGSVVSPELIDELRWRSGEPEDERVANARDLFCRDARGGKGFHARAPPAPGTQLQKH